MKIGILCENYFPTLGGEQEHILNLRRHLESPEDDHPPIDVRIIVPRVGYEVWQGPPDDEHVFRPARSFKTGWYGSVSECTLTPRALPALHRIFAKERFDLLHIHAPCDIGLPGWALMAFRGPIVGTIHSYFTHAPIRTLAAPWYRYVMRRMTRVIAVSEAARDTIARYARFACTIIGNGVDCRAFASGRPIPRFSDGARNILTLGRLEQRNGIDLIIAAFAIVARELPDVRLLIAGDGQDRRAYEAQVAALPPSTRERAVFLGPVWNERADLYASAHCFALAARKTSFSILLLEALAAGLRVAGLRGEGTSNAGEHWSLVEMASAETPDAYAAALTRVLTPAPEGYTARARAMAQTYDWSRVVPRIRDVYHEALSERRC